MSKGKKSQSGISFSVPKKIKRAIDAAKTEVTKAVIVGKVRAGHVEFEPAQLAKVTKQGKKKSMKMKKSTSASGEIIFVALNAPFRTKALTAAL
jgi:hypothetical protein